MNDTLYKYAIIGFGIAGQLVALELLEKGVPASSILCFDPNWLGGTLKTEWSCVKSNTPWWKPRKALEAFASTASTLAKGDAKYQKDECFSVGGIADLQMDAVHPLLLKKNLIKGTVTQVSRKDSATPWTIKTSSKYYRAQTLFFTQGGSPKELDVALPTIPLSKALDILSLKQILNDATAPTPHVVVFGCSHSGTLVLKNLDELSVQTIAIYKTEKPFCLESEGFYGGLKEQSAQIAKEILDGKYSKLSLCPWTDPLGVHEALTEATHVVYAIGFEGRTIPIEYEGKPFSSSDYDPKTGALKTPDCYGFGLAYPSVSVVNEKVYPDISSLAFQEHIRNCLSNILI